MNNLSYFKIHTKNEVSSILVEITIDNVLYVLIHRSIRKIWNRLFFFFENNTFFKQDARIDIFYFFLDLSKKSHEP